MKKLLILSVLVSLYGCSVGLSEDECEFAISHIENQIGLEEAVPDILQAFQKLQKFGTTHFGEIHQEQ